MALEPLRSQAVHKDPKPGSTSGTASDASAVLGLLRLEGDARGVKTLSELAILVANETRKLTRARQIFVLRGDAASRWQILAASGLAKIDRNVPLVQWIESTIERLKSDVGIDKLHEFVLQAYADAANETAQIYPFRQALWFPLKDKRGAVFAGVLMLRDEPWASGDHVLATRLSTSFSQSWYWIATNNRLLPTYKIKSVPALLGTAAVVALALFPVSMTTLAPLEISARDPVVIAAPIDGVIHAIPIDANSFVKAGESVVQFVDTNLRNRLAVAEREAQVADAKVKKTLLLAVSDLRGRHELAIARAELAVKMAEWEFARENFSRANIVATKDGIAVFGDKRDILGKPVSVGERIMELADPMRVEVRVDVPVSDAIIITTGARVKVFLDSAPLVPLEAKITRADYQAKAHENGGLAFRVTASLSDDSVPPPRLGIRGTAEVYGSTVPFAYYVFRRPISGLRQWIGL